MFNHDLQGISTLPPIFPYILHMLSLISASFDTYNLTFWSRISFFVAEVSPVGRYLGNFFPRNKSFDTCIPSRHTLLCSRNSYSYLCSWQTFSETHCMLLSCPLFQTSVQGHILCLVQLLQTSYFVYLPSDHFLNIFHSCLLLVC